MILLNPGPVTLSERVRAALAGPDLCHREPEFGQLQARVRQGLLDVYGLDAGAWQPVLLSGSGTAAVEAMLVSLVPPDGHLVTVENGVYGERMTSIARAAGIEVSPVTRPWQEPIDLDGVARALDRNGHAPTFVAAVHHETTTGRLNDLEALASVCSERGARLLLDGVSSFGGEWLDFDGWPVEACAATANKCLHGAPGVAFVLTRRERLESPTRARSLYLDLAGHWRSQQEDGTAFTPAIPALYGLDAALAELDASGGWQARRARYAELAGTVATELESLGVTSYLPAEDSSVVLRSYRLPEGMDYPLLHDGLKSRGFVIYAGQGAMYERLFRISTMGVISDSDMQRLRGALREVIT